MYVASGFYGVNFEENYFGMDFHVCLGGAADIAFCGIKKMGCGVVEGTPMGLTNPTEGWIINVALHLLKVDGAFVPCRFFVLVNS